uniref:nuclear pore glycoprotein p62 isoform X2 n=1 Tax=Myxine glutinosa TaxID=7769 RepID=UPI0035902BE3
MSFTFGKPNFAFGATNPAPTTTTAPMFNFGGTPGLSSGQTAPASTFSFGMTPTPSTFGVKTQFGAASGGFSFNTPGAVSAQPVPTGTATAAAAMSTPFSFGTPAPVAPTAQPMGLFGNATTPALGIAANSTVAGNATNPLGLFGDATTPALGFAASSTLASNTTNPLGAAAVTAAAVSAPQPPATSQPAQLGGFSFGNPQAATGTGTGTGTKFSFGTATDGSAAPKSNFSFVNPVTTTGFMFGNTLPVATTTNTAATAAVATSTFAFGGGAVPGSTVAATTAVVPGLGLASAAASTVAPALSFSLPSASAPSITSGSILPSAAAFPLGLGLAKAPASTVNAMPSGVNSSAPTSGFSLSSTAAVPAPLQQSATAVSAGSGFSFGLAAKTTSSPLGTTAITTTTSTATSIASPALSLFKPAVTTTASTTTATAVAGSNTTTAASMTYGQLEEIINKWSLELEEQEKQFLVQATQVNAWDRVMHENGDKITALHKEVEKVKLDQKRLDQELDFILGQQRELEELLNPLEDAVKEQSSSIYLQPTNEERERTYKLAENIDAQLKRMSQDLKEVIDHLNTSSGPGETADPLQQICKILNAHMGSLQWIDQNAVYLQKKVDEVAKLYEARRSESEAEQLPF